MKNLEDKSQAAAVRLKAMDEGYHCAVCRTIEEFIAVVEDYLGPGPQGNSIKLNHKSNDHGNIKESEGDGKPSGGF